MTRSATELEAAQRLRGVVGRLSRLLRRTDNEAGVELTPTRVAVLLAAERLGPIRLAEIAEREGLNPTLLSRTIAYLVSDGLLERSADPEDRRSAWVQATDTGHATARNIRAKRTQSLQDAIQQLDGADVALLEAALPALERLAEAISEEQR